MAGHRRTRPWASAAAILASSRCSAAVICWAMAAASSDRAAVAGGVGQGLERGFELSDAVGQRGELGRGLVDALLKRGHARLELEPASRHRQARTAPLRAWPAAVPGRRCRARASCLAEIEAAPGIGERGDADQTAEQPREAMGEEAFHPAGPRGGGGDVAAPAVVGLARRRAFSPSSARPGGVGSAAAFAPGAGSTLTSVAVPSMVVSRALRRAAGALILIAERVCHHALTLRLQQIRLLTRMPPRSPAAQGYLPRAGAPPRASSQPSGATASATASDRQ